MERRTEVLRKVLGLGDRLAEFITQHYCPEAMSGGDLDTFYILLASIMDVVVEGMGTVQALERRKVLDVVKVAILGDPTKGEVDMREYKFYMPTLSDIIAVLNLNYYTFVSACLSEEHRLKLGAEVEKVEKKVEEKTEKEKKKKTEKKKKRG
jgi:hypothetical protein